MSILLKSLPRDLATLVVLSGVSLKPEKLAETVEMVVALNALRMLDKEKALTAKTAERLVENTMTEFHAKLADTAEK